MRVEDTTTEAPVTTAKTTETFAQAPSSKLTEDTKEKWAKYFDEKFEKLEAEGGPEMPLFANLLV